MTSIAERLKALRESAQPDLSVRKMASKLGCPPSSYAAYEDPKKFKRPILPLEKAKQFADVLGEHGVDRKEVLALAGVTGELTEKRDDVFPPEDEWLTVTGSVAAGIWKAQSDWPEGEHYDVRFGQSPYPKKERFAVRMEGLSMNKTILPGSDLECLWVKFSPVPAQPGDLVIVERQAHDLVELTVKRLAQNDGQYMLLSESTEEEFEAPILIGSPDDGYFGDDEIRVVGIVLSAKLDLAPKNLSERRYKR